MKTTTAEDKRTITTVELTQMKQSTLTLNARCGNTTHANKYIMRQQWGNTLAESSNVIHKTFR